MTKLEQIETDQEDGDLCLGVGDFILMPSEWIIILLNTVLDKSEQKKNI